ncbi:MAG: pseudouridine-5'-phosphate glycosidase [Bacteroidetes bacterium]|nr:MAG: pseudouridine-5'-phosphate glycosidase [Bacteroidota bacterium]
MKKEHLEISKEVQEALQNGQPVVALESTIISHGMPYPKNVETALKVEQVVRDNGAIPATIAIIKGTLKVGISAEEIDYLGKQGTLVRKTSRRDIPFIIANKLDGATTVASTMILADLAGIRIFATGGIGGVHRGGALSMDISADLEELAKTNVAVVCAGVKSILDLELTMEYLETKGVPVVGFGTNELPAFYTRTSRLPVDYKVDDVKILAKALNAKWKLGLNGGMVIANPIPEAYSMDPEIINEAIDKALAHAEEQGIKGKHITPFLLAKVESITSGNSLFSNIQLVYNNAKLAAELAKECHYC